MVHYVIFIHLFNKHELSILKEKNYIYIYAIRHPYIPTLVCPYYYEVTMNKIWIHGKFIDPSKL